MSDLQKAIVRSAIGLGLFAIVTAGVISVTELATRETIIEQRKQARARALFEVISADQLDNDLVASTLTLPGSTLIGQPEPIEIHVAQLDDALSGIILPIKTEAGYSGPIELIVGLKPSGKISGVRAVNHKETPGLGDRIEANKSSWIAQFNSTSLQQPGYGRWAVQKDGGEFDQLSGATITSRAVVNAVRDGLSYYQEQHETILAQAKQAIKTTQQTAPATGAQQ